MVAAGEDCGTGVGVLPGVLVIWTGVGLVEGTITIGTWVVGVGVEVLLIRIQKPIKRSTRKPAPPTNKIPTRSLSFWEKETSRGQGWLLGVVSTTGVCGGGGKNIVTSSSCKVKRSVTDAGETATAAQQALNSSWVDW
jgi:hypothetical protein